MEVRYAACLIVSHVCWTCIGLEILGDLVVIPTCGPSKYVEQAYGSTGVLIELVSSIYAGQAYGARVT